MENRAVLEGIRARRSVRRYIDRPVEQEKVDLLLECACAAPSAVNRRPWRFVVVRDRGNLNTLAEVHPYGKMLFQAPLALVVCGAVLHDGEPNPWWEEDCAAAMQNILLAWGVPRPRRPAGEDRGPSGDASGRPGHGHRCGRLRRREQAPAPRRRRGGRAPRALDGLNERDLRYLNVCFGCPGLASLSGRK